MTKPEFDIDAYMAWEEEQAERHEYLAGEVFPMWQLRIDRADAVFYPDVFVTCDLRDRQPDACLAKQYPSLIVEVLSDSTAAFDRGRKFELYQQIDTLREYLLIEQDREHADLFRKNDEGLWVLHPAGPGDVIRLDGIGAELALEALYEDVEL